MYSFKKKFLRATGGAIIEIVVVATGILTGGLGLLVLDAVTCDFNVIFNDCDSGGGGGGGGTKACSSPANACGMKSTGFKQDGVCNATTPPNSDCPVPVISTTDFYAQPSTVGLNGKSKLFWDVENATSCEITGDNGFTHSGKKSGSVNTGALTETTAFTLTCENGDGGPTTGRIVRVIVDPHYQEL